MSINSINFLPASFGEEIRRRRRRIREALLLLVVVAGMCGWWLLSQDQVRDLRTYAEAIEMQARKVREQRTEIAKLETRKKVLQNQVKVQRELTLPVSYTQILATIGTLMPDSVTLTDINVRGERPVPRKPEEKSAKAKAKANSKQDQSPAAKPLQLELVGIAPSGDPVSDFMMRLNDHALFANVKMVYSRAMVVDNYKARQFRLELTVPVDRDFVSTRLVKDEGQGVVSDANTLRAKTAIADGEGRDED